MARRQQAQGWGITASAAAFFFANVALSDADRLAFSWAETTLLFFAMLIFTRAAASGRVPFLISLYRARISAVRVWPAFALLIFLAPRQTVCCRAPNRRSTGSRP